MRFYVLSKCIEEEKGDIIINLETKTVEKIKLNELLEEDKTYVYANGELIQIKNIDWTVKETYLLAFHKNRKINIKDYKFIRLGKEDEITLDENYFMYCNGNLLGRITNHYEIEMMEREGLEKTRRIVSRLLHGGIAVLTRGKKVYRIFTYLKLKSFLAEEDKQISIHQYLDREKLEDEGSFLEQIGDDLTEVYQKIEQMLKKINKKKDKTYGL